MKRALRRLSETWRGSVKPNVMEKRSQSSLKHLNNYFVNKFNHALERTADFLQSLRRDNPDGRSGLEDGNSTPTASPGLNRRIQESLHLIPITSLNNEIVTPPRQVMRKDKPLNYKAYLFRGEKSVPRKRRAHSDLAANTKRPKSFVSPDPHDLNVSEGYTIGIPQRGAPMLEIRVPNYNAYVTGGDKSAPPKLNASRFPTPTNSSRKSPPHPPRPPMNGPTVDYMFGIMKIPAVVPQESISKNRRRPIVSRGNRRQPPELNSKRFGKTTQQPLRTKQVPSPATGALSFRKMQERRHEAQRGKLVQNWQVTGERFSVRLAQQARTVEGAVGCTEPDDYDWEAMWEARRTPPVCGKRKRSFSIVAYMEEPRPRRRKLGLEKYGL